MPANVRLHGVLQAQLGELKGLVRLALRVEDERLHRLCVAMAWVLFQDLLGSLETL